MLPCSRLLPCSEKISTASMLPCLHFLASLEMRKKQLSHLQEHKNHKKHKVFFFHVTSVRKNDCIGTLLDHCIDMKGMSLCNDFQFPLEWKLQNMKFHALTTLSYSATRGSQAFLISWAMQLLSQSGQHAHPSCPCHST